MTRPIEGRARLAMELLAVEQASPQVTPVVAATPAPQPVAVVAPPPLPMPPPARPEPVAPAPKPVVAEPTAAAPRPEPAPPPAASPTALTADGVAGIRARWAEVVASASPALRPLLSECRPVALDGARLTLAFPEERGFMREKVTNRAGNIEQLLAHRAGRHLGGRLHRQQRRARATHRAAGRRIGCPVDPDGQALLDGVLRITGGELVDAPEVH